MPTGARPSRRTGSVAPLGRRACEVVGERAVGRLPGLLGARPRGARAAVGPVLHARRRSGWGSAAGRPYLPRAISVAGCRARAARACGSTSCSRRRARHAPARGARGAASDALARPARSGARSRRPPSSRQGRRGRSWSAAGSGSRRWPSCAATWRAAACRSGCCSAFATAPTRGGLELFDCSEVRLATEDGHAGHRGLRHRPARRRARRRRRRPAPASTHAGRRRCWRRFASGASPARSPAELAMEAPMACGFGACFGCAVPLAAGRLHAALRRRPGGPRRSRSRRRWSPGAGIERARGGR